MGFCIEMIFGPSCYLTSLSDEKTRSVFITVLSYRVKLLSTWFIGNSLCGVLRKASSPHDVRYTMVMLLTC